ncbi:MAG: ATP-sensitive inward rectifier potassium channel 10 [Synechococcales cyanobacterium RU_4_20]|nr:ATP-sensitive inward rectifier potassium channel 10 [Synechococcales cyanobacterium RU_4_20]
MGGLNFRRRLSFLTSRAQLVHLRSRNGQLEVEGLDRWYRYWRDPYHLLLTVPWWVFVVLLTLGYVGVNALFAWAYLLDPNPEAIANAKPDDFADAFFFSVQTLGSIGYGAMHPTTLYTNSLVALEAMASMISIALITGLAFTRFARSQARVSFSEVAVVEPFEGHPTLVFRTANRRRNQILEAQLKVYLLRDEISQEGQAMRRFYQLDLIQNETPRFTLGWTVMHPITPASPLYGETIASLEQRQATILVSLSGLDETIMQPLHARQVYAVQDLRWNHRFVDMIYNTAGGDRYLDYRYFNAVEPVPHSGRTESL